MNTSYTYLAAALLAASLLFVPSVSADEFCADHNVRFMPISCTQGTIVNDTWDGCRHITCADGSGDFTIKACNTIGNGAYELWWRNASGAERTICVGETCLASHPAHTYALGNEFPVCGEETPNPTARVRADYPMDHNVIWTCDTDDFVPDSYEWHFGDGTSVSGDYPRVFHTYTDNQRYTATCIPSNDEVSAEAQGVTTIYSPIPSPDVDNPFYVWLLAGQQSENTYRFTCEDLGWIADEFTWTVDGTVVSTSKEFTHTFAAPGTYDVQCTATLQPGNEHGLNETHYKEDMPYSACSAEGCMSISDTEMFTIRGEGGGGETCTDDLQAITASCTGGTITSDESRYGGGCREIVCEDGADRMQALACDKGEHFEIYRQERFGTGIEVCLGDACVGEFGFDRQDYPVCSGEPGEPGEPVGSEPGLFDGLVSYYPEDGNHNDLVSGHNGEELGTPVSASGKLGGAFDYGVDGSRVTAEIFEVGSVQTVSSWVNFESGAQGTIWKMNPDHHLVRLPDGRVEVQLLGKYGGMNTATSYNPIPAGEWHNYVVVWADGVTRYSFQGQPMHFGGQVLLFIDGELQAWTDNNGGREVTFTWGGRGPTFFSEATSINAVIDELGLWNRSLSESEIDGLYNNHAALAFPFGADVPVPNVCYDRMNEMPVSCEGTIVADEIRADGCRYLTCSSGASTTEVKACNRNDWNPVDFEMFRYETTGAPLDVCVGDTCLDGWNYRSSEPFPYCEY